MDLLKLFRANSRYQNDIPDDDLIAKQRYRLFRTTTLTAGAVIFYAFVQATFIVKTGGFSAALIGLLNLILVVNYFLLPVHRNHRFAYYTIVLAAFATLHIISYYSGGLRASAIMYMAGTMLLAYMLLGNQAGRIVFGLIALHIIYFWYVTENTAWISYKLIGDSAGMVNFDYLTTFFLAMLILSAQMSYLESGKNIVIERITDQRNELHAKNRELHKLSLVASKAENAITITDGNGVATWVNDGFVRLSGFAFEEVVGNKPHQMLKGEGTDSGTLLELESAMQTSQSFSAEILRFRKNGTPFWTQITMTPIADETGEQEKFIFIESDITTRKMAEDAMHRYMHNLEKTNAELDKFAYVVSHDLKAPLRAIGNLTGCIEEDIGDQLPEDARNNFKIIKSRVLRMEGLIDGILDYTKASRKVGEWAPFSTEELILETIELLGQPANAIINVRDHLPVIKGERVKLQQVFMNLIHNALKYNDKEDVQVDIGCREAGASWEFFVRDNGPGIDPRYHEKIFVIFQTLNARDEVEARGVGLAIVKKIIEDEGGIIRVDSQAGNGACFSFTWPKERKEDSVALLASNELA
jgi:PAS domain S-box-containing protein